MANKKSIVNTIAGYDNKSDAGVLFGKICSLIEIGKANTAVFVNRELTLMYWQIGNLIQHETLKFKRADYGGQIIATLSHQLTRLYGKGFTRTALTRMTVFAKLFSHDEISATLSHQLSWSHFFASVGVPSNSDPVHHR